ncbi:aromatic ring-hydroxylating oxygenase subunit alpha [Micromonospora inositola]|uniref:Phenylpropionate dioxygenase, large terminal subunit n=1 Tax=Micromonospora inositola TaxID=47865 RepID=A0A1C5K6E9_9ACTN|nr:aromatic ring-hydroxylating dioxygenase subunit alpha [Micromonospora inositola]SCG78016.1 Phenylpropionate dioxygenase, large terminal subunit [Micromonospora inositola]
MKPSAGARDREPLELSALVDVDAGTISREIFINEQIFRAEMDNLFARAWLFIGHESQIPEPGDYFASRMGSDPVLLTRDSEGEIHVLLNSCRHRGMKVCRYDSGNTLQFTCPYHGWSYSVDGELVSTPGELFGVPQFHNAYGGKLRRENWGLVRVSRTVNYKGLIFATWDDDAPAFEDYVGGFMLWIDNLADTLAGVPAGTEAFGGVLKWRVKANWKFVAENFLGDMYHAATTHASVEAAGIGPAGANSSRHGTSPEALAKRRAIQHSTSFYLLGHGATDSAIEQRVPPTFADHPELTEYFADLFAKKVEIRKANGQHVGGHGPATLFPSMSFHSLGFPRTILVAHPISPNETELWRWFIVDKDARPDARDWLRGYYMRYSGPAGLTEQDDMENWDYATDASRGAVARRYDYNYAQGLGHSQDGPIEGTVESVHWSTEENARNFYRRWLRFAEGQSWASLMDPCSVKKPDVVA